MTATPWSIGRRVNGRAASQTLPPAGRGYWIDPAEPGAADEGASRRAARATPRRRPRHAARPGSPARPRRNRRVLVWMALSTVILATVVIAGVLMFTGGTVVPGLTAKLFPIQYQEEIARAAAEYGQDPYLVAAMVKTESGYDTEAVSPVGAQGLMQLMPDTAEWVAGKLDKWEGGAGPDLTDPADNLELGVWYLDYLSDMYDGDMELALAAYNAGHGNVDKWLAEAGGRDSFDVADIPFKETRDYVERVERYRSLYLRIHPNAFE